MLQDQNTNDTTIQKPTNPEVQDNTENAAQDVSTDPSNVEADVAKPQQDAQVDSSASLGDSGSTPEAPQDIIRDLRAQLSVAKAQLAALASFHKAEEVKGSDVTISVAESTPTVAEPIEISASDQTVPDSACKEGADSSVSSSADSDSSESDEAAVSELVPEMAAAGEVSALPVEGEV